MESGHTSLLYVLNELPCKVSGKFLVSYKHWEIFVLIIYIINNIIIISDIIISSIIIQGNIYFTQFHTQLGKR